MVVGGGLTDSCEKKRRERQRRKGKIYPFECRVPKNRKQRLKKKKKASSVINGKKQRKTKQWERLEISSRKLDTPREHFMQR